MKQEIMAEGPRCKRRKQANPRRKNVLSYGSMVEVTSDTDEEDQATLPEESGFTNGGGGRKEEGLGEGEAGSLAGVPPLVASPLVGHALLTHGQQESSGEQHGQQEPLNWRLDYGSDEFDETVGPKAFHSPGNKAVIQLDRLSDLDDFFLKRKLEGVDGHQGTIADYLQRSDTAIIYPEAPEEATRLSTPEAVSPESEHEMAIDATDDFAQLLTCPYCQRGYKRLTSLKEHIKYRHEKNEGSFACPLCADTFAHRAQLERHMAIHKIATDQPPLINDVAGNRKFKCSECGKAFKYKHHLKEHLRIHSGEKPYECSNCKKRFSHSGSYSSHISSKKCIGLVALNGRVRNGHHGKPGSSPNSTTSSPGSPSLSQLRHKLENGRPLGLLDPQVSLDIKAEPLNFNEYRMLMASQQRFGGPGVYMNGQDESPMGIHDPAQRPLQQLGGLGMDLSVLSYVGPFGHHLTDVQKVLQIVDNTMCAQKLEGHPEISKLRAYMKELGAQMEEDKSGLQVVSDGSSTKSIIDYTLQKVIEAKSLIDEPKRQVGIKKDKPNHSVDLSGENTLAASQSQFLSFSCQFCKETFTGPIPLHQHERYLCNMNEDIKAVLPPESRPTSQQGPVTSEPSNSEKIPSPINPFKNYVSLLKTYFAMNAEPNTEELIKISIAVGLPQEFVKEWFTQWKNQNHCGLTKTSPTSDHNGPDANRGLCLSPAVDLHTKTNQFIDHRQTTADKPFDSLDHLRADTLSPLNLSSMSPKTSQSSYTPNSLNSEEAHGDTPLDLSLPKHMMQRLMSAKPELQQPSDFLIECNGEISGREQTPGSLDLINIKKEILGPDGAGNSVHSLEKSSSPIFGINPFTGGPIYTSLPHHGAFSPPTLMTPSQATIPNLRPYAGLDPMGFLPHMAFTYATGAATFAEMQQRRKYQQKPGFQGLELLDVSCLEEATESDLLLCRKKMKKTESGTYACDLCDKTFQKTSSLLRHKYEHTGKRPHQCQICKKAFKHKHHLIEHSRLHSGEKPYQCDKCGKRFSHSGSYSQHMNHRYSYCKREAEEREAAEREARQNGAGGAGGAGGGGGLEPHKQLIGSAYLQGMAPLGYSDHDDQQEDGMIRRDGGETKAGVGWEETEGDGRAQGEVTDGQGASPRGEEEEDLRQTKSVKEEKNKDLPLPNDKSSGGGKSGDA